MLVCTAESDVSGSRPSAWPHQKRHILIRLVCLIMCFYLFISLFILIMVHTSSHNMCSPRVCQEQQLHSDWMWRFLSHHRKNKVELVTIKSIVEDMKPITIIPKLFLFWLHRVSRTVHSCYYSSSCAETAHKQRWRHILSWAEQKHQIWTFLKRVHVHLTKTLWSRLTNVLWYS